MSRLVGRDAELALLRRTVRPEPGTPRALLLLGEAGIGKTSLLDAARAAAAEAGRTVLAAQGWPADRSTPFAGLRQLLAQVYTEPDGTILDAALRGRPGEPVPDGIAVWPAVAALLGRLGRVVVVVDDLSDCDQHTLDVLGRLLRHPEEVVVLLAADTQPDLPGNVEVCHLAPLPARWSAELLAAQPGAPEGRRRLELLDQAQGNPAALLELCRRQAELDDPALTHARPRRAARPSDVFAARLRSLPARTRRALLYAAVALPGEDVAVLMTALGTAELGVWAPAEAAGLIRIVDGRVEFGHPLARIAAYTEPPLLLRHRAHRDLAELADTRPLDRARHQAEATLGRDAAVAARLRAAAGPAPDAFTSACALADAADLAEDDTERAGCLADAMVAALAVGEPTWVLGLYARFLLVNRDPARALATAGVAATALSLSGRQQEAADLLLDATERGQAVNVAGTDNPTLAALALARSEGPGGAVRAFQRLDIPRLTRIPDGPERLADRIAVGSVAWLADEPDVCLDQYRAADEQLRARRAFGQRAGYLAAMVDMLLATGQWAPARALLAEGLAQARLLRLVRVEADLRILTSTLAALGGEPVPVDRPALDLRQNPATQARLHRADALVAIARGDWTEAYRRLRALFTEDGSPLHPVHSSHAIAELALAGQRTGQVTDVAHVLARVRTVLGDRLPSRLTLQLHHATALVDPGPDPAHHFGLALVNADGERWPLERAQARLSYASWLRRTRRPSAARQQLTAALAVVEPLGAEPVAAAIRHELRACGGATASAATSLADGGAFAELTAQQRQIVRMAAAGLSNREIAEQLFLSPRTVGTHLYHVYPKLGVSRRQQLRDLLRDG